MSAYDVFNGDADGLCALRQWRLAYPGASTLVTGIKRDNALVAGVPARAGDEVNVFDLGLHQNVEAVASLLERGVRVRYFDHHAGPSPKPHPALTVHVDTSPDTCTSLIVDRVLNGLHRPWAIVGAFGDNLSGPAFALARGLGATDARIAAWRDLGETLNYNAYGACVQDLVIAPDTLYRLLETYDDPLEFAHREPVAEKIRDAMRGDLALACAVSPTARCGGATVYELPDAPWSRRVVGAFANKLARERDDVAFVVFVPEPGGTLSFSVRIPRSAALTADAFARRFGGGGRRCAGGGLGASEDAKAAIVSSFLETYGDGTPPSVSTRN